MKVVINKCFGGYSVSKEVYERMGKEWDGYGYAFEGDRTNPDLIAVIEEIGSERASGTCAELRIIDIPENATDWELDEYDGAEDIICVVDGKIQHLYY